MAEAALEDDWPRTVAEFEAWHSRQVDRWEFIGGQPCLMAPGSKPHTIIKGNVFAALRAGLQGTACQVFTDGVQILNEEISAIPDAVVTCGPVDLSTPVVAEPAIIVEVMSPWSETDDTQRKWFSYRKIASLRHYLVVATGPARGAGPQPRRRAVARALLHRRHDRARRSAGAHRARRLLPRDVGTDGQTRLLRRYPCQQIEQPPCPQQLVAYDLALLDQ
jgi:hypothetical protein